MLTVSAIWFLGGVAFCYAGAFALAIFCPIEKGGE